MNNLFHSEWLPLTVCILSIGTLLFFFVLYRRMHRQQQQQLRSAIEQLRLLRVLLADFQKHRGLSTGILSGDSSLQNDLSITRNQLDKSISQALQLETRHQPQWHILIKQWQQIRQGSESNPAANLLSHHELIRNTTFLIEDIASELDLSSNSAQLGNLSCIWREVVQTAEWTGQARALGTGIAAGKASSAAQRVRLRFLHAKIKQLSTHAFVTLAQSETGLLNLQQPQHTINEFLLCLEEELLNCEYPKIEAKLFFDQATLAINDLLGMLDAALTDLQHVTKEY
ncbi:MAG: hypothetical protein GYB20_14620 [Oceanospirillales bacterium]|nr:hypothetical protein [Oceanospirillales bacterium]MBR9888915.1 hypothetical protein [Oceanospirillales bacterium]